MTKIVLNTCYGGFSLSEAAMLRYAEIKGFPLFSEKNHFGLTEYWLVPESERPEDCENRWHTMSLEERIAHNEAVSKVMVSNCEFTRHDPVLVQVVEELKEQANGSCANLEIIAISGSHYRICVYDGLEWVETPDSIEWVEVQ